MRGAPDAKAQAVLVGFVSIPTLIRLNCFAAYYATSRFNEYAEIAQSQCIDSRLNA
jgi:hypothetical protein